MTHAYHILPAFDPGDIERIGDIGKCNLPLYYNPTHLRRFVADDGHVVLKATVPDGRIVGFMVGEKTNNEGMHIKSISTDDDHRRMGVGTALLAHAQREYDHLSLYVDTENIPAIRCYTQNGFVVERTLDKYYRILNNRDAYLMTW
jgi:ribosomal protein S18 acetylase RimI-like enzyme